MPIRSPAAPAEVSGGSVPPVLGWMFALTAAAYNLVRLPKLITEVPTADSPGGISDSRHAFSIASSRSWVMSRLSAGLWSRHIFPGDPRITRRVSGVLMIEPACA